MDKAELLSLLVQYEDTIAEQGRLIAKLINENFEQENLINALMKEHIGEP